MKYLKYLLYLVILLAIIFFGKGIATPSIDYICEVSVNKPVEEVWAVMTDESKLPEWLTGFKRMEHVSGTPGTKGAVSRVFVEENGEVMAIEETIMEIIPKELMSSKYTMDFMDMDYEMFLEEKDGKTYIRTKSHTEGNGIFAKSILSFMSKAMKQQEDENLNKLKKVIEENTNDYFPEPVIESKEEVDS